MTPPRAPTMVTIAFNALPRATRERLVSTLLRKGPVPLVAADQGDFTSFVRRIVAFAGLALACAIVFWNVGEGFGEPSHPWFRWSTGWLGIVTVMTGVLVWVALRAALALYLRVRSPVPLTTYVLPLDIIEFRGPLLRILTLSGATGIHKTLVRGRAAYVIYDFAFPVRTGRGGARNPAVQGRITGVPFNQPLTSVDYPPRPYGPTMILVVGPALLLGLSKLARQVDA